jgi:hypothetical protein
MATDTISEDGLNAEIAAYESMQKALESEHTGKWVLVKDRKLIALYDSFETAAQDAVHQFGRGPYLIRQIGASPVVLPASIMFPFRYA